MQKNSKFFEDIAKLASGAGSTFMEMKHEIDNMVMTQVDKVLRRMNLVTREEFDAVKEMAAKARTEQEKIEARLEALEKTLAAKSKKA